VQLRSVRVFVLLVICSAVSAPAVESLEQTIAFLLHRIETADATFIRNGQTHTPQQAVAHVRAKYEHFKGQIKTPEDFIRLAALTYRAALPRPHPRWQGGAAQRLVNQRTPGTPR
jgi:Family of unknown function (DUF5329)